MRRITESFTYKYSSSTPIELNLNTDVGLIDINYVYQPVDYLVRVDVNIEMVGPNLAGKSYSDYFSIVWQNSSSFVNFTMELKEQINQAELLSLIKIVNVTIVLNSELACDINILVNIQGGVKITVPRDISVGNIIINISKGDIQYEFTNCILEGNLTGLIQETGNIDLKINDVKYSHNCTWVLNTGKGDFNIDLIQYTDMNANVSGIMSHDLGNIKLKYEDDNADIGAYFILNYNENDPNIFRAIDEIMGFERIPSPDQDIYYLRSYDYPARNNYNILFNNANGLFLLLDLQNN